MNQIEMHNVNDRHGHSFLIETVNAIIFNVRELIRYACAFEKITKKVNEACDKRIDAVVESWRVGYERLHHRIKALEDVMRTVDVEKKDEDYMLHSVQLTQKEGHRFENGVYGTINFGKGEKLVGDHPEADYSSWQMAFQDLYDKGEKKEEKKTIEERKGNGMKELTVGTIVRLKSGGPEMTIRDKPYVVAGSTTEVVRCVWFDDEDDLHEDVFAVGALDRVEH